MAGGKPYLCSCGRKYKNKFHMQFHQKHECGKEPAFSCPYCPYRSKRRGTLNTHVALRHTALNLHQNQ